MGDPRISCIIPVRDGERHLAETLASVVSQTVAPAEVIVVDDGSTDRSAAIAASFGVPVRLVRQPRGGVSRARNRGLDLAHGELIAFLDADDLFVADKLARQCARFRARPEIEMSAAHTVNFWSNELSVEERDHDPQMEAPWPRHISTWVIRRSVFDRVGTFDETMPLSQDVDWHLRAHAHGVVIETLPDVLSRRRLHAGNATRQAQEGCRAAVLGSLRRHLHRGDGPVSGPGG